MTPSPNRPPHGGRCSFIALTIAALLIARVGGGADRVEIIIDDSAAMWSTLGGKVARVVALRQALAGFALATSLQDNDLEIGLRTMGGRHELIDDGACDDTGLIVPIGPVVPAQWQEALGDLFPRGRRPLARSLSAALKDLADSGGRIVLITAGGDECRSDVATVLAELAEKEAAVKIRVIGLSMDRKTALALTGTVPIRNLSDAATLLDTLFWAANPSETPSTKPMDMELRLSRDGQPVAEAEIILAADFQEETWTATISGGAARISLPTGRYHASLTGPDIAPVEFAGIVHSPNGDMIDLALQSSPPVTLAVAPERPISNGSVLVDYWGAPGGAAWVTVASADAPLGAYLVRRPVTGSSGMAVLRLPGLTRKLEARLVHETSDGILELLGRTGFQCTHGAAKIDGPEEIESGTPLSLGWEAPNQPGDHITIALADGPRENYAACIPTMSGGPATLAAPIVPGAYDVRYISSLGKMLASSTLEVFEVLATLEGPAEISAGEELEIIWTGPNGSQDYLSIAEPGADNEAYLEWALTGQGNPLRLRAPRRTGDFELRYVRAADGEVLARRPFRVVAEAVSLRAPPEVEAGSRFVVEWSGTSGRGDFIAIAKESAAASRHLDWSYTTSGRRLTLAAPVRPGRYEVRYVSGANVEILARQPLMVR
jgi:Ca-activated chloride channel family protein